MDDLLIGNLEQKQDKRVNVKDILSFIFQKGSIEQKTILSISNRNAIVRLQAGNRYFKEHFGFEIELYKGLIDDVRINTISVNARGRTDIIEAVKAMQDNNIIPEDKKGKL